MSFFAVQPMDRFRVVFSFEVWTCTSLDGVIAVEGREALPTGTVLVFKKTVRVGRVDLLGFCEEVQRPGMRGEPVLAGITEVRRNLARL